MVVMAYTDKAKPRLLNLKITVIYSDAYAWAKLIAEKMNGVVRADEFYSLAEECIIEQTPRMPRCIRGKGSEYLYKKIPEMTEVCFSEYPEFIAEVKRIAQEKELMSKEALASDPVLRTICA